MKYLIKFVLIFKFCCKVLHIYPTVSVHCKKKPKHYYYMIPYDSKDVQNFNYLLTIIMSSVVTTEDNVKRLIPNEQEFKLVHIINEHYPSFKIENGFYLLTKDGIEIQNIGLKQYYIKVQTQQQLDIKIKELTLRGLSKSDERNKRANRNSLIAIGLSIIIPILILIGGKYLDYKIDKISNTPSTTNSNGDIGTEINPPNIISDTLDSFNKEIISNKIFHNSDTLNFKLIIK